MRRINLVLLLVLAALMGITPALMWLAGRWATILPLVDARWMDGLGALIFTVPVALAVTAIILAVHGMLLNRALAEYAMEEFLDLYDQAGALQPATDTPSGATAGMVVGGVAVGAAAGAAGAGAVARSRSAADAPPPTAEAEADAKTSKKKDDKDKKKGKGKKKATRMVKRGGRTVSRQGKTVVRRQIRGAMPRF